MPLGAAPIQHACLVTRAGELDEVVELSVAGRPSQFRQGAVGVVTRAVDILRRYAPILPRPLAWRARNCHGGENDLFSGQCPRQRGHGMRAWQYGHETQVPLPPQNADNS